MDVRHPFLYDPNNPAAVIGFRRPVPPGGVVRRFRRLLPVRLHNPQNREDIADEIKVKDQSGEN